MVSRSMLVAYCALMAVAPALVGCGGGPVQQESIEVKSTAFDEAKQILQMYADGGPYSSEASAFPDLINRAKAEDAEKGAELEKALNEIQANPNNRAAIAKQTIPKL